MFIHSNLNTFENDSNFQENQFVLESDPDIDQQSEESDNNDDDIQEIENLTSINV